MGENRKKFADIGFGGEFHAAYASKGSASRGRLIEEEISATRTDFQRDRDRIIHSTAFRRLAHKTQVFIHHEGDHYRTRLTHSLEVAQIARSIARALRLDEDLAEALALAHDLGHTPFGHAGEDALAEAMRDHKGFEHNAQTLRIVTALERRYAHFDGLNLTWETLEGIVKHNGPLIDQEGAGIGKYNTVGVPPAINNYCRFQDLMLSTHASLEAQAAAIADDIAYNAHDIDDGLQEGLFHLDDLKEVPLVGDLVQEVALQLPPLDFYRTSHEVVRRLITRLIEDVISTARKNIANVDPKSAEDVRYAGKTLVSFSPQMIMADRGIKAFLFEHMYRVPKMMAIRENAKSIVHDLFAYYMRVPEAMDHEYGDSLEVKKDNLPLRISDYVAGMTDRFAVQQHNRLFDVTPDLR